MLDRRAKTAVAWLLWTMSAVAITILSLLPPSRVGGIAVVGDKTLHAAAYLFQGALTYIFLSLAGIPANTRTGAKFAVSVFICLLFGLLIEVLQPLTGRNMEMLDLAADAAGAFIGTGLAAAGMLLLDRRTKN